MITMHEVKMTYKDWERVYNNNLRKQRAERRYFIKQRISGLFIVAIGIASIFIEYDITFSMFAVPIGLYVIFTKQNVISTME